MCEECDRLEEDVEEKRGKAKRAEYALIQAEDDLFKAQEEFGAHLKSCAEPPPEDLAHHQAAVKAGQVEMLSGVEG